MRLSIFTGNDIWLQITDKQNVLTEYKNALESVKENQLAEEIVKKEVFKIEQELKDMMETKYKLYQDTYL